MQTMDIKEPNIEIVDSTPCLQQSDDKCLQQVVCLMKWQRKIAIIFTTIEK